MVRQNVVVGLVGGLVLVGVTILQLTPVRADDRMQLGASLAKATEFQSQVGDRVFFSDASAELGTRGRAALEAQAAWLQRHPSLSVVVEGHADDGGDFHRNLELSQRRADAVGRRLVQMGVVPERIRTVAYGRERPIAQCAAGDCAAQNRRAVTIIGPSLEAASATGATGLVPRGDWASRRSPRRLN